MAIEAISNDLEIEYFNILRERLISTFFQPIVSLANGEVLGYEALSRGPVNSPFYSPDQLFSYAKKVNKVWELDLLCRLKAIERAESIIGNKLLFINIDPDIINDPAFRKGFTKEFLHNHKIHADSIIFELTEHTAVTNYKIFKKILNNYRQQGYRIALDDAGDGYSGLRLMTEIRPNFIKIDMNLIRDIDKDMMKKELLKSFQRFSEITNIQIIAEGIETYNELKTLIEIGIPYGQGYYLQKPSSEFSPLNSSLIKELQSLNIEKYRQQTDPNRILVDSIKRWDQPLQLEDTCEKANEVFVNSYNLQGITVLKGEEPVGLIMRHKFYYKLKGANNKKSFLQTTLLEDVMDHSPLILEKNININDASKIAMSREESRVYDYIIITEGKKYKGILPVAYLLNAFTINS